MKLICDHNYKPSMMRVGFLLSLVVGSILSIFGCIAMFYGLQDAGVAMTAGTALMGGSSFAKAAQSKWESTGA